MNSLDAIHLKELPAKGINRYFVWLVKSNQKFSLSDAEYWSIAKLINKAVKS